MAKFLKRIAKLTYELLPFKLPLFRVLRTAWTPPASLRTRLGFRGEFELRVEDTSIRLYNDGYWIEQELFWTGLLGGWERESIKLWLRLARSGRLIIDVGANTGVYAMCAHAVGAQCRVVAFEPVPRIYERLLANVRRNGFDIRCVKAAASNRTGTAPLFDLEHAHHYIATIDEDSRPDDYGDEYVGRTVEVEVIRLQDFLHDLDAGPPDLLKIDVEGHDPEVVEGLGDLIQGLPSILVELMQDNAAGRLHKLTAGLGYLAYQVDEESGPVAVERPKVGRHHNVLLCSQAVAASLDLPEGQPF